MDYTDDQLDRAFNSLSVIDVARYYGHDLKIGLQKSPFREDKNGKSFSVYKDAHGGLRFKDHADPSIGGGAWHMCGLCAPFDLQTQKKDIRNALVTINGEEPKNTTAGAMRAKDKETRQAMFKKRDMELLKLPDVKESSLWSDAVKERWNEGLHFDDCDLKFAKVGASRGWSADDTSSVVSLGKMSAPALPWNKKRGCAFKVEKPVSHRGTLGLVPIGYHQRDTKRKDGRLIKDWYFIPHVPGDPKSDFQKILATEGKSNPAYPFVLGDRPQGDDQQGNVLTTPKLVLMTEGQWDAISLASAFGWLETGIPGGICILGLRGVQSHAPLLAGYGHWLQKHKPFVWYIGDNDVAGARVLERTNPEQITAGPSFIDRLRALGCKVYTMFLDVEGCKDFNDIYKAHGWCRKEMQKLAAVAGCGDLIKGDE